MKIIIALCSFLIWGYADTNPNTQLIGKWQVTQWISGEPVTQLSTQQVHELIGQYLIINSQTISFKVSMLPPDDETCAIANDSGWIKDDPINYFNNNYAVNLKNLDLQSPFWILDSDCIQVFTTSNSNHIIFTFGGDFFQAVRVSNS